MEYQTLGWDGWSIPIALITRSAELLDPSYDGLLQAELARLVDDNEVWTRERYERLKADLLEWLFIQNQNEGLTAVLHFEMQGCTTSIAAFPDDIPLIHTIAVLATAMNTMIAMCSRVSCPKLR